jgi:hypothetical protein
MVTSPLLKRRVDKKVGQYSCLSEGDVHEPPHPIGSFRRTVIRPYETGAADIERENARR